ncbi:MAG: hypothetical protein EZS28_028673 [Streblomastix strix]|uniref:Uncharacterized protein n=1 Tax=Streblomastix strix TaxID=222440 RepID=A0A5J4V078_9EUKA|nr:MAG: hypothetical protein EZS28_028673 [Streblomastix strix]
MEKPIKPTNAVNEQHDDGIRGKLAINPTADANRQQGANGGNLKSNRGARDEAMEPNIFCAQTDWRMEEDIRLQNAKQGAYSQTFQDDRHMRYNFNAEKRRLDVHVGYNISLQPHKGQLITTTIPSIPNIRSQLYISWDAIWDKYCAIHIRENDTTNNREVEREMLNTNIELCGRYNTVQQQQIPNIKGDSIDKNSIRIDGIDNKSIQEQTGPQEINNISRMELEHRINDAISNQTNEETGDGSINQISATDTAVIISNRKKRSKVDWSNPIYKSSIHTRRSSYHVHESENEQTSKESRNGYPNQVIERSIDRGRMVDDINQEQQTQEYRNTQDLSNDNNGCIFREMGSDFTNTRRGYTKSIKTVETKDPYIEQKGNNSNFISIELILANIATQPFALPEGNDRQHNSMLQLNQRKSESRIEKASRPDPSIHRGIIIGSQVQAHPRSQEHRS